MFCPNCFEGVHVTHKDLHNALKTIGIISAISAVVSLAAGIFFCVRTVRCMDEMDASLPVLGKAAEKYLNEQQSNSINDELE